MIVYWAQMYSAAGQKPQNTAIVIKNYLQYKEELEVMVRPPQSPDINII